MPNDTEISNRGVKSRLKSLVRQPFILSFWASLVAFLFWAMCLVAIMSFEQGSTIPKPKCYKNIASDFVLHMCYILPLIVSSVLYVVYSSLDLAIQPNTREDLKHKQQERRYETVLERVNSYRKRKGIVFIILVYILVSVMLFLNIQYVTSHPVTWWSHWILPVWGPVISGGLFYLMVFPLNLAAFFQMALLCSYFTSQVKSDLRHDVEDSPQQVKRIVDNLFILSLAVAASAFLIEVSILVFNREITAGMVIGFVFFVLIEILVVAVPAIGIRPELNRYYSRRIHDNTLDERERNDAEKKFNSSLPLSKKSVFVSEVVMILNMSLTTLGFSESLRNRVLEATSSQAQSDKTCFRN